eukprot:2626178-Pleurochrysis_carterae.AAC.2
MDTLVPRVSYGQKGLAIDVHNLIAYRKNCRGGSGLGLDALADKEVPPIDVLSACVVLRVVRKINS